MKEKELKVKATKEEIAELLQELRDSFAPRTDRFFSVMGRKIIAKEYSIYQLKRAINKTIEDSNYNELSISTVLKACEKESPYRIVEYERLRGNRTWEKVVFPENIYNGDLNMYSEREKPKFIRYID